MLDHNPWELWEFEDFDKTWTEAKQWVHKNCTKQNGEYKFKVLKQKGSEEEFPMTLAQVLRQPLIKGMFIAYASILVGWLLDHFMGW